MSNGTNRPPKDSDQIVQLRREVDELKREVASLLRPKPRTHPATLELARTFDDGAYPVGYAHRIPIVFRDASWDSVEEETVLTDRSESRMAYALAAKPLMLPPGATVLVKPQRSGRWLIAVNGFRKFVGKVTQSGGIPASGSGTVEIYQRDADSGEWVPMLNADEEPVALIVYHPPPTDSGIGGVAEGAWVQCEIEDASGLWVVDVEYCPEGVTDPEDPTGNCCTDGVLTTGVLSSECTAGGGTFIGESTECEEVPTGRCCLPDGTCTVSTQVECEFSFGGVWNGAVPDCTDHDCEPTDPETIGLCCDPESPGGYTYTTFSNCELIDGTWIGGVDWPDPSGTCGGP